MQAARTDGTAIDLRTADVAPRLDVRAWLASLTFADAVMALIGVVAAVARLTELGRLPLSAVEAEAALGAWQFTHGGQISVPIASPAYFALTGPVMGLLSSDITARLVPALLGIVTVLLPWLWRGRARPAIWLTAAAFLAASPLHIAISRSAGGDAIAVFALTLLVMAGGRRREGSSRWAVTAGAALGLGLTSAPLFYTGLIALVPAWWVFAGIGGLSTRDWRRLGSVAALTFAGIATCILLFPAGIGSALDLLPAWLAQFGLPRAGASGLFVPVANLLRYEPALLLLGVPAVVWAIVRGSQPGLRLTIWLGLVLAMITLQSGTTTGAAAALAPGYLLLGIFAGALVERGSWSRRTTWLVSGGLLLLGMVLLVSLGRFTRLGLWTGGQATLVGLATLAFVFAGIIVIFAVAWDNAAARLGAVLGVGLLLLYWQWGIGWQLSHFGANDPREQWVVTGTDDDVLLMMDLIAGISRQTANSETDLEVFSMVDTPVLRWYFRKFTGFAAGQTLPLGTQAAVILTPQDVEPALSSNYFGTDFGLEQRDIPGAVAPAATFGGKIGDFLRWWLFRESSAPLEQQAIILWVRSDLATAGDGAVP